MFGVVISQVKTTSIVHNRLLVVVYREFNEYVRVAGFQVE